MIELAQVARGATMLILSEAARRGFIHGGDGKGWDVMPGVKELSRFLGIERQALDSLGLQRREKPVEDLATQLVALRRGRGEPS